MQIKIVKDYNYVDIYDVYYKRWWGWQHRFFVTAGSVEGAKEKANLRLKPISLTWEI